MRLIRGPDPECGDSDGKVCTVVEVGDPGNNRVVVRWDTGHCTSYGEDYQKSYSLRILDSAPAGRY